MWLYLVNTFEFDAVRTDIGRLLAIALFIGVALLVAGHYDKR